MIGVLTLDAKIDAVAPTAYVGMDRFVARKKIVKDLEALGLLIEVKKHKLMVPRCARTGQIIEPMLTDQWFVTMGKVSPKTRPASRSRKRRSMRCSPATSEIVPENWVNTY